MKAQTSTTYELYQASWHLHQRRFRRIYLSTIATLGRTRWLVGGIQVTTDFKAFTSMFQLPNLHNFIMVLSRSINLYHKHQVIYCWSPTRYKDRVIKLYKGFWQNRSNFENEKYSFGNPHQYNNSGPDIYWA